MKRKRCIGAGSLVALALAGCHPASDSAIPLTSSSLPPILLFNGAGTSPNDVAAFKEILDEQNLKYSTASSSQLNEMSETRLRSYRLLIIPGGNYINMGNGILPSTATKLRDAVHSGLNYLGVCAGGLIAGDSIHNGLNLTSGVRFDFYAAVNQGVHKAAVPISCPDRPPLDQYWEDGPQFSGWGESVARYPDGTPAVVQGELGHGWVILCGFHPEAPVNWRRGMNFRTPVSEDNKYAAMLIHAALDRTRLQHFPDKTSEPENP
jgi:glutamine amidotransferase-like uncharacterized protein